MKHKEKIKIARSLLTKEERLNNTPIFSSTGWFNRKRAIAGRVERQQKLAHERWAKQYDCCQKCGTTDYPHHGHGLCRHCKSWNDTRIKDVLYKTIHVSCPVCSRVCDTGISIKKTDASLEVIHKLRTRLEELHQVDGDCQHIQVSLGNQLQSVIG